MPPTTSCPTCGTPRPLTPTDGPCPVCESGHTTRPAESYPPTVPPPAIDPTGHATSTPPTRFPLPGDPDPLAPDRHRADRYELLGEVGHGGMGSVLRAIDHDLGRELAVKVLRQGLHHDTILTRRFLEEARITG